MTDPNKWRQSLEALQPRRPSAPLKSEEQVSAGFWPRAAAYGWDAVILAALSWPFRPDIELTSMTDAAALMATVTALFLFLALQWFAWVCYHIGFEILFAATPGKHLLGLRVVDLDGAPVTPFRIVLRFFAAGPSWVLMNFGHLMALRRPDRLTMHDLSSKTRVVQRPAADWGPWPALSPARHELFFWLSFAVQAVLTVFIVVSTVLSVASSMTSLVSSLPS